MRRMRNILIGILSICLLMPMWSNQVLAASGSVTLSGGSGEVGSTVTVSGTVKCSSGAIGAATVTLSYDPSGLKFVSGSGGTNGSSGSVKYAGYGDGSAKTLSFSIKFKILKEGSFKISGSADGYNFDEQQLSMKVSGTTVTGKVTEKNDNNDSGNTNNSNNHNTPATKSNNTKLNSLKVYPGTLSPAFSSDTRSYTVSVPEGTTEVTITAVPQSDKATFYTTGGKDLKEDEENAAKVVVTAEDGTTNSYSLKITIEKKERITIDTEEYTVESIAKKEIPSGFEKATISYEGKQLSGLKATTGTMQLLALASAGEEKAFYIVDTENKSIYPFHSAKVSKERTVILLPITDDSKAPEGMQQVSVTLNKKQFDAWKEADGLYVFPVVDNKGNEVRYRYDEVDKTYQRYVVTEKGGEEEQVDVAVESKETILPEMLETYYDYVLIGTIGIIVILVVLVIALAVNADKRRRKKLAKIKAMKKESKSSPWIDL